MAMNQVPTHIGNYHHGAPKTNGSFLEKERVRYGNPHADGRHDISDRSRGIESEMEGRYDKYARDGKFNGMPDHVRHDKDAYTESRHHEYKDYYTTYTAKGTVKADHARGIVSDYALVVKDAKQKVGEAFEAFAKNPSDDNRAKLEEAMIHKYKASEAFNKLRPLHLHRHEPFHLYKIEIKSIAVKPSHVHAEKAKNNLSPFEVTEAARDVLRNAYSSRRDNEPGIKELRAEAYKLYVNALSEEFKATGKIAYTNHTPSTPNYSHRFHNKHNNLPHFTKLKDDTFKSLQDIINNEKGFKWGSMSGARKAAFDSHLNSLANWLQSGGKPQQNNYFIVSIKIIQPIKLHKASYSNFGHGHNFKILNHRIDDSRRSHMASHRGNDNRRSHMVGRNGEDDRRSHKVGHHGDGDRRSRMVGRNGDDDERSHKVSYHRGDDGRYSRAEGHQSSAESRHASNSSKGGDRSHTTAHHNSGK